jgi:hypothetical protein
VVVYVDSDDKDSFNHWLQHDAFMAYAKCSDVVRHPEVVMPELDWE